MSRPLLSNVQILRFVAAMAILLSHAGDLFLQPQSRFWAIPWTAGVDIFFVISGFVMVYLTDGQFGRWVAARDFMIRRLVRVVPPYWLFTTLMVVTVMLFGEHVRNSEATPAALLTSYAFIPWPRGDGALNPLLSQGWTLNHEMFFYAAFALALTLRRGLLILCLSLVMLSILHRWIPQGWFPIHFWSRPIILEFVAGMGLGWTYRRGARLSPLASSALAGAGLAMLIGLPQVEGGTAVIRPFSFGIPALMICAAFALSHEPRRTPAWRRALIAGCNSSYTLYLSHVFSVHAVQLAWQGTGAPMPGIGMTAAVVVALAIAHLVYRGIERPMIEALQRRFTRVDDGTRDARSALR